MGEAALKFESSGLVDVSDKVSLVLVPRDESQSEFGNKIPLNHEIFTKLWYPAIGKFNASGKLKIGAVETSCGAHPQVNILSGIHPLPVMRDTHRALPKDVPARLLVRGPFGVGLNALADEDLYVVLKQLALASGAADGRKVIFKLFEAQNNPKEHEASIKILKLLKQEGLDIECEGAISYTAEPEHPVEEYQGHVADFIANDNKHFLDTDSVLTTVSLKDMIGGLDSKRRNKDVQSYADAEILVNSFINEIEKQGKGPNDIAIAIHCHETGYATEANVAAAIAAVESGYKIKLDVMAGGRGFAQALAVIEGLREQGYDAGISAEQEEILRKMAERFETLAELHEEYQLDPTQISMEDRRNSHIPGGAVPTTISRHIIPLARELKIPVKDIIEAVENAAKDLGLPKDTATETIVYYMRQAWRELGNPHSVTPGADNLAATARQMALNAAHGKTGAALYDNLSLDLLTYWRGKMPHNPDSDVFKNICGQYLKITLPKIFPGNDNQALRESIIFAPTDKNATRKTLSHMDLSKAEKALLADQDVQEWMEEIEDYQFYLKIPDYVRAIPKKNHEELAAKRREYEDTVAVLKARLRRKFEENDLDFDTVWGKHQKLENLLDHIGARTFPISKNIPSRLAQIVKKDLPHYEREGLIIKEEERMDLVFEALIMRGNDDGGIDENLVRALYCFKAPSQVIEERLAALQDTNTAMQVLRNVPLWS